jgi:tRNA-specific adenosine deaminase 1
MCRRGLWMEAVRLAGLVGVPVLLDALKQGRYEDVKGCGVLAERRQVKEDVKGVLKGWVRNSGDDDWALEEGSRS